MKVKELIEFLSKQNPEAIVFTNYVPYYRLTERVKVEIRYSGKDDDEEMIFISNESCIDLE